MYKSLVKEKVEIADALQNEISSINSEIEAYKNESQKEHESLLEKLNRKSKEFQDKCNEKAELDMQFKGDNSEK